MPWKKKPNFFIIGMSKAGTTALSEYLRTHPNVFFSKIKELYFFSPAHEQNNRACDEDFYLQQFSDANEQHIAIGEGTPTYYRSIEAIKKILAFNPEAKFILMIRNPIERFFSIHSQLYFYGIEKHQDPKKAWQQSKKQGFIGKKSTSYIDECKAYCYIKEILTVVNKEKIHIMIYDNFKKNTQNEYYEVLDFLDLPRINKNNFSKINANRYINNRKHHRIFIFLSNTWKFYKKFLGVKNKSILTFISIIKNKYLNYISKYKHFNHSSPKYHNISNDFILELKQYFKKDIELLSALIDKNLLFWLE